MSPVALPSQHAAVLYGPRDLRLEERTAWAPLSGHVQVAVAATGLCGSDLHYYMSTRNGDFTMRDPLVLGHEAAGVVTSVGPGVTNFKVGQRVAIEPGVMCSRCDYCAKGRYNLCRNMRFCSSAKTYPHLDGTLQNRINHPAKVLHPLPDACSYEQGALAEPLSVLLHASSRANIIPGQTVLVFGVGTIGLLACALAQYLGASYVVAVDINRHRLDFAKANGFASHTFCLPPVDNAKTSDEQLRRAKEAIQIALTEFDEPDGFDIVFECSGAESCIQMSCYAAISGGKVMLVGMGSPRVSLPLAAAALREVDIFGSFRYANTYPKALALLATGKLKNVDKIITHRFPLKDAAQAFELLTRGHDSDGRIVLKVMIV